MPGFELVLEPFLNFACFRFDPRSESTVEEKNRLSRSLLEELNRRGKVFLTHTVVNGRHTLRVHFGQTYIEREHVDLLLEELKSLAHGL
jgi:aromatic-L-amino-acid decarboxylase